MKKALFGLMLSFVFAAPAFAHEGGDFGTVVCFQNPGYSPIQGKKIAVVMQQIQKTRNYQMRIFEKQIGGARKEILSDVVRLTTEDVMASFRGPKAAVRVSMMIYMDELNQSNLSIGKTDITMLCKMNADLSRINL